MGKLVICPDCDTQGVRSVLGSVTDNGDLSIMRHRLQGGITIIKSDNYAIICQCGYGTVVSNQAGGHQHINYDATT